ncbi:MAG: outer membrane lipoprotein carrier protein LolA [Acidobacteria bacterium]|nr:outer membrane lipoprotein carrier protein LolA [Acidobacteriota bacterium]
MLRPSQCFLTVLLGVGALSAQAPAWWTRLQARPSLEAAFAQEGESAVFGKVSREGTLRLAPGGRLRVAYTRGLLILCDGKRLIQFDPDTRSAQRLDLKRALAEVPLLTVLMDPREVERHFRIAFQGERVTLTPKEPGMPTLEAEGRGGWPERFQWTDATGARQVLRLKAPRASKEDAASFTFVPPPGTRWAEN